MSKKILVLAFIITCAVNSSFGNDVTQQTINRTIRADVQSINPKNRLKYTMLQKELERINTDERDSASSLNMSLGAIFVGLTISATRSIMIQNKQQGLFVMVLGVISILAGLTGVSICNSSDFYAQARKDVINEILNLDRK